MSQPGILLDRDGTIIVDSGYVGSVDRVEFIDGSIAAIAALNRAGIPVAVVTNQAGVARGYYGIADVEQVHKHMIAELARHGAHVDLWLFCPYHPDGIVEAFARRSADRKPGPGMALAAAEALDLDLGKSWVVGDSPSDVGLARAIGARPLHVGPPGSAVDNVDTFPDLAAAVRFILGGGELPATPRDERPVKFPAARFHRADSYGGAYVNELSRAFATVDLEQVSRAAKMLGDAHDRDAALFACGNGGSASIANHLQCDHVKGVRNSTGITARVQSLSTNVELFSAIANDLGYEHVFEYQLQSQARPGDVLIAISSSGRSPNIVRALDWAAAHGMHTIALTGFEGGPARRRAHVSIHVDSANYGVVEDAHQACMHLLAQYVRQSRMTPDAVASQTF
ncbi:HAD-IIIA family hydrolase [Amycolatopsis thermophila]|uniref:D,D-heptose 1,7-bisphosphate phosphatase n=1 Tax=Amycolatopsis thermophila TaxID=206084 RepID=A0ABU0ER60_9PSEU|nr:HAD-IIIA family hydrolase [Amycolatopsis thermophila]MDQ0377649.1 D-sedoheptulose 7-phosphate isomerase/D-glycero-D-manno-heptose 1,7-bisphosphate phosphatase [Amycolatopsis thermophila]